MVKSDRSLQNLWVDLVLPADVENVVETLEMELLEKFVMFSVDGPSFTAIEKCCQDNCSVHFDRGAL